MPSPLRPRQGPPRQPLPPPTSSLSSASDSPSTSASSLSPSSSSPTSAASAAASTSLSSSRSLSSSISNSISASSSAASISSTISSSNATSSTAVSSSVTTSSTSSTLSSTSSTRRSTTSSSSSTTFRSSSSAPKSPATTFDPVPATTLVITGQSSDTTSIARTVSYDPSSMATNSPVSAAASSNGFWGNKGAVGGTFAVVGVVVLGVLIFIVVILRRRRAARLERLHQSLFDNYGDPQSSRGHGDSPEPSISGVPLDPFQTRQLYGNPSYPVASDPFGGNDSYIFNVSPNSSNPNLSRQPEAVPQVTIRSPGGRDSSVYQQSIDSFYGVAGQPRVQAY